MATKLTNDRDPVEVAADALTFGYTNYRGEYSIRRVIPDRVWFGSTSWHPEPQWLLSARDLDKGSSQRDFALRNIVFQPEALSARLTPPAEVVRYELRGRMLMEYEFGEYVRYEDHAAALAASEAKRKDAEDALRAVRVAVDKGRMVPKPGCGVGGMTIDANLRGSNYTGISAWEIEQALAALDQPKTEDAT